MLGLELLAEIHVMGRYTNHLLRGRIGPHIPYTPYIPLLGFSPHVGYPWCWCAISWCSDHLISCDLVFGVGGLTSNFMLRLEVVVGNHTFEIMCSIRSKPFKPFRTVSDRSERVKHQDRRPPDIGSGGLRSGPAHYRPRPVRARIPWCEVRAPSR